jgi:hypothetical protein
VLAATAASIPKPSSFVLIPKDKIERWEISVMPNIRRRLASAAVLAGMVLGATLMVTLPASAAPTPPCPADYYCFYEHTYYRGWHLNYRTTRLGDFRTASSSGDDRRNESSSVINNGNRTICIYDDLPVWPNTLLLRVAPYQDYISLPADVNDKADYWKMFPGQATCPTR